MRNLILIFCLCFVITDLQSQIFYKVDLDSIHINWVDIGMDSVDNISYVFVNGSDTTQVDTNVLELSLRLPYCLQKVWAFNAVDSTAKVSISRNTDIYIKISTYAKSKFLHLIEGQFDKIEMMVSDNYQVNKTYEVKGSVINYGFNQSLYTYM